MKKNILITILCFISYGMFAFETDSTKTNDSIPKKEFVRYKKSVGIAVGGKGGILDFSYGHSFYLNDYNKITARIGLDFPAFMDVMFAASSIAVEYQYNFKKAPKLFCKATFNFHLADYTSFPIIPIKYYKGEPEETPHLGHIYAGTCIGYSFKRIDLEINAVYVEQLTYDKFKYITFGLAGYYKF